MNIREAKEQIKNAMTAYFTKDEFGNYRIPIYKQRPVLLIGPPGIGKTAIMEQIASELGVGLVSYSMTHHTRQSALGLPFITTQEFDGRPCQVTEYTMSEIIASLYKMMKETGVKEGILFLDEINCVSETLAPAMLQFLQYKIFGQHRIPDGWIVVTAGNPPEYNKSVRDFDIVTWDRLKRIDVEPDYEVWKSYASSRGVHPAVLTYLEARKKDFYKVESTVDGKNFVTPRGWDDLSEMIRLYEENGIRVDGNLICQYLQDRRIAKDFAIYYDLFNKYRSDYRISRILAGNPGEDVLFRARRAPLDERLSFLGLLFDAVTAELKAVCETEDLLDLLLPVLKEIKEEIAQGSRDAAGILEEHMAAGQDRLERGRAASSLSPRSQRSLQRMLVHLEQYRAEVISSGKAGDPEQAFALIRAAFGAEVAALKKQAAEGSRSLNNAFSFCEQAFEGENEILIFVTELTVNYDTARFIGHYGCDKYYLHNKELQFAERQAELTRRVEQLDWDV